MKASSGLRVESTRNSGHHVVEAEMQVCGTQLDGKLFCAKDMTRRPMANSFTKLLFVKTCLLMRIPLMVVSLYAQLGVIRLHMSCS